MKAVSRFIISLLMLCGSVSAQELRCTVNINADKVDGSNKQMFQTLQQAITDYVNNSRFTTLTFTEQERIECSMMMIVNSVTNEGMVNASLQVQSRRPVYGTSYASPLINIKDDDCSFLYQEFDRIEFQPTQFTTNLAAILTYYCYLILGYDLDSYSRQGGSPCFQQCENIVSAAQSASIEKDELSGWKAFGNNRNRYTLINNLMDGAFSDYRNYFYEYHRLGLDVMSKNVANGRAKIASGLTVLREVYKARPATYVIATFLDAKNDELVQIFKKGTDSEKKSVVDILSAVDPTRMESYEKINE
ncbi:MAG: DUF4835 family protein [Paludibacteraceae bacterium]|nr:DUF4835 family protein [Paludibacteraceae bacterium]